MEFKILYRYNDILLELKKKQRRCIIYRWCNVIQLDIL